MNAVDTNVLVYFVDCDEPSKQAKATMLLEHLANEDVETVLLWQVAAEFLSCLRRWENRGRIDRTEVLGNLIHMRSLFRCVAPTEEILNQSLELSSRHSLSHWDSMLLAACATAGVTTLYSEDLDVGTKYGSVTTINAF